MIYIMFYLSITLSVNWVYFSTYNNSCAYSWGYQIWKDSQVTFQRVEGIAGKRNPLKLDGTNAKNVYNAVINEANSGIGFNAPNDYFGADLWVKGYWK